MAVAQPEFSPDTFYEIQFNIALADHIVLSNESRLKASIYVADFALADVPASHLKTRYYNRLNLKKVLSVRFNGAELRKALEMYHSGQSGLNPDGQEALFYLHWSIDLNGDGQFCPGDLIMDYSRIKKDHYEVTPETHGFIEQLVVPFTKATDTPCEKF